MGTRGPAPARSDERRRRNQPSTPTDKVEVAGEVEIPDPLEEWHPTAVSWYRSLADSGQSRFYEPTDWQAAHFCAGLMSQALLDEKPNAQLVAQVRGLMTDLLVTEGARRRAGMEIMRRPTEGGRPQPGGSVTRMADRRKRLTGDAS